MINPVRVLIADKDEPLLEDYVVFFREIQWKIAVAKSGIECVEQLQMFKPDVLVLEPELPWGGGSGVLAEMHRVPGVPITPVIILTTGNDKKELTGVLEHQIEEFQLKPYSPGALAHRICRLLDVNISRNRTIADIPTRETR